MNFSELVSRFKTEYVIYSTDVSLYDSMFIATKDYLFCLAEHEVDNFDNYKVVVNSIPLDCFDEGVDSWINMADVNEFSDSNWTNKAPSEDKDKALLLIDIVSYYGIQDAESDGEFDNIMSAIYKIISYYIVVEKDKVDFEN